MYKTLSFAVLASVLSLGTAYAAGQSQEATFSKLDTNHDGYISQDEAKNDPSLEKQWGMADKDHNNQIDSSEFSAFESMQSNTPAKEGNE